MTREMEKSGQEDTEWLFFREKGEEEERREKKKRPEKLREWEQKKDGEVEKKITAEVVSRSGEEDYKKKITAEVVSRRR